MSGGIPLRFGARVFNVKDFGAVGDGLAHPLSAFFPILLLLKSCIRGR